MIDTDSLKVAVDCRELVRSELGDPASKSAKVWHWLCPFHADGKTPSLAVYADGFKCYGCGEYGDVFTWLQKRHNLTFLEAVQQVRGGALPTSAPAVRPAPAPHLLEPPAETWQTKAVDVMIECMEVLWSGRGKAPGALAELHKRGLSDDTIKAAWLGYQPADGERRGLFVPRGVVIPHWHGRANTMWGLKIWRPLGSDPKYTQVKGSVPALYGADNLAGHDVAVVCEGEFDALLLAQQAGDLAGVVTFGSATSQDIEGWLPYLLPVKRLLVATDNDAAGEKAWQYWHAKTQRVRRLLPPGGAKDITDAWRAGADLRAWLLAGMG